MNLALEISSKIGLMIAAPNSGSGKTVVTLALLRALRNQGVDVGGAKAGPDFIDPAFHEMACRRSSYNLDPWSMSDDRVRELANATDGSHLLVEGMMGLYDGAADGTASSADLAITLGINVVLVINVAKQSHSIAALVKGFCDFQTELNICGVILNQVGSERHEKMLKEALAKIGVLVIGVLPRCKELEIPERHLGLVQIAEMADFEDFIANAASVVARNCDLDLLLDQFSPVVEYEEPVSTNSKPPGNHIAIAKDVAFSFIYPHLLNGWRNQGVRISFFSPLADEGPAIDADMIYLPGGYPELYGENIANAANFSKCMTKAKNRGTLIYGECGGYMVLGKRLYDRDGIGHTMLGFLDLETSFEQRKLNLGYRNVECVTDTSGDILGEKNWRGHEFHYSTIISENGTPLFRVCDALGQNLGNKGLRDGNVMGSYMHLINPQNQ